MHKVTSKNLEKIYYKTKFQFSVGKFTPVSAKPITECINLQRCANIL